MPDQQCVQQSMKVEALATERPLIYMSIGYQASPTPQTSYLSPEDATRLASLLLEAADDLQARNGEPTTAQVEAALKAYGHGLAEKIRDAVQGDDPDYIGTRGALWAADLIDPEVA